MRVLTQNLLYENEFDLLAKEPVGGTHESKNSFELIKLKMRLESHCKYTKEFMIGSHFIKRVHINLKGALSRYLATL